LTGSQMRIFFLLRLQAAVLVCLSTLSAAAQPPLLSPAHRTRLARKPTWLKLLHFDAEAQQSEILSKNFFLSPTGRHDAEAELAATVAAYSLPWPENGDRHARCRFPARYFWLARQINLPDYTPAPPQCTTFARWSLPDKVRSVSLFLVSGYLGNPASVFGHALLKLNAGARDDQAGLFDLTVSYGALVPQNEPVLRYILHGLGGGYQAGFSDRYFYTQDLVYSRTEFRDIWEYELRLSDRQRTFLLLHLWEILGKKFTYYFLDKNCAYRLAELLELVLAEPLLQDAKVWCVPVEIFHRLEELDQTEKAAGQPGLLSSVRFIPSAQRRLRSQFSLLKPKEQEAAQQIIQQGQETMQTNLVGLKPERQAEVLDALLAYSNYRLVAEQPDPSPAIKALKNKLLPARFLLPPSSAPLAEPPALDSPAAGNRPMLTGLGLSYDDEQRAHLRLRWAPFLQEALGRNSLAADELAVLDTTVGAGGQEDAVFLDRLDLLRIRKIKTNAFALDEDSPWSWQLRSGLTYNEGAYDALFAFGVGRAWNIRPQMTAYLMTDAAAHSLEPYLRLRPHAVLLAEKGIFKSRLLAGLETSDYQGNAEPFLGAAAQWSLAAQLSLFVELEQKKSDQANFALELKWFW
jgi:hypothetical protein